MQAITTKRGFPLRVIDHVRHTDRTIDSGLTRAELVESIAWMLRGRRGHKNLLRVAACIRRDGATLHFWHGSALLADWNVTFIQEAARLLLSLGLGEVTL